MCGLLLGKGAARCANGAQRLRAVGCNPLPDCGLHAAPEEILQKLDRYQSKYLVKLVDSRVDVNAEAAMDILLLRGDATLVAEGLASRAISTRSGRIRALRALLSLGEHCPEAREAYLADVGDSSSNVDDISKDVVFRQLGK